MNFGQGRPINVQWHGDTQTPKSHPLMPKKTYYQEIRIVEAVCSSPFHSNGYLWEKISLFSPIQVSREDIRTFKQWKELIRGWIFCDGTPHHTFLNRQNIGLDEYADVDTVFRAAQFSFVYIMVWRTGVMDVLEEQYDLVFSKTALPFLKTPNPPKNRLVLPGAGTDSRERCYSKIPPTHVAAGFHTPAISPTQSQSVGKRRHEEEDEVGEAGSQGKRVKH